MITQQEQSPRKFGRLPRARNPGVPHMAALMAGRTTALAPVPPACDYTAGLPADMGGLGNLAVGDCTSAGKGHALQVWSRGQLAVADADALEDYREVTGWSGVPGDATDAGAVEQASLKHWLTTGFPLGGGAARDFLHSFFEADPGSYGQLSRGIYECGAVYLGFRVPAWMEQPGQLPQVWDRRSDASEAPVGGHCVVAFGYARDMLRVCSWGQWYWVTMAFVEAFVSEAYPLVSVDWVGRPGRACPLNLTLAELDEQMAALRAQG